MLSLGPDYDLQNRPKDRVGYVAAVSSSVGDTKIYKIHGLCSNKGLQCNKRGKTKTWDKLHYAVRFK